MFTPLGFVLRGRGFENSALATQLNMSVYDTIGIVSHMPVKQIRKIHRSLHLPLPLPDRSGMNRDKLQTVCRAGELANLMSVVGVLCPLAPSDECLLARFADGERAVLEELFGRYRAIAYRVAHRLLGNEADALDAVQDGFIKALTRLNTFQGRSSFKTWLLRVVSNAALDLGRQRGRRETASLDAPDPGQAENVQPLAFTNPAQGLEREDLRKIIQEALGVLSEAQRQTFVLHADGDLSYKEVAETLGISIGTVMSRLYYARQKLRQHLGQRIDL
jgi:RNA polymerase sigma-70 factor (ECF subfamily)